MARRRRVRRDQPTDRLNNVLQCTAILLVVLKELSFDIGGVSVLPIPSRNYGLQPCGVFIGPLKPQKAANLFKATGVDRKIDVRMYDR